MRISTARRKAGAGLEQLKTALAGAVSVLVGQSGVGKSSLVSALLPEAEVSTGELMREEEGRHTTTASRAYSLAIGGTLIDSPGVRDFAPAIDQLDARTLGFPEVERLAARLPLSGLPPHAGARLRGHRRRRRERRLMRGVTRVTGDCVGVIPTSSRLAGPVSRKRRS